MELNGHALSLFQLCRRKFKLESTYRFLPWSPHTLLSAVLRQAILSLSHSTPLQPTITAAINSFTANCKTPGINVPQGTDTYALAMDYCATIRTILTYLSTTSLPPLHSRTPLQLTPMLTWSFLSLEDANSTLHRFSFPPFINDDSRTKEGHSWELFADLVLGQSPLTLHMISTGRRDGSHLTSPWCRAYRSPAINLYRFQKKDGTPLGDNWKPVRFDHNSDPELWVDSMLSDNIISTLVRTYVIPKPDPIHVANFHGDLTYEIKEIGAVESSSIPFHLLPITRPVCDSPYVCPHQSVCYSLHPELEIERCGLYEKISLLKNKTERGRATSNATPVVADVAGD